MASLILEIIRFIVNLVVLTAVFYMAGIIVVGRKRALPSAAFIIALLGIIISTFFMALLPGMVIFTFDSHQFGLGPGLGLLISFFVYLLLIRHYYETGWLGALAVAILAVVIFVVLAFVMAVLLPIPFLFFT
jgi:ABC-type Fe3+-siderophore transport system permease subunit